MIFINQELCTGNKIPDSSFTHVQLVRLKKKKKIKKPDIRQTISGVKFTKATIYFSKLSICIVKKVTTVLTVIPCKHVAEHSQ